MGTLTTAAARALKPRLTRPRNRRLETTASSMQHVLDPAAQAPANQDQAQNRVQRARRDAERQKRDSSTGDERPDAWRGQVDGVGIVRIMRVVAHAICPSK